MTVRGPYDQLEGAWKQLAGIWPATAQMRPRGVISYERYHNTPDHSRPEDLVTRLYLPVE
ncbi:GyrI-like domain-containing protein [Actibacterium sp. XHP0104]|uniref:GyrI-like domain-containing protein n=1 Tax=Actibacterium sp. XHP0104 TaxID=2984335 RepID=UPI0021E70EB3|nr:GyrI-like domain-containing protein [Actibacterium sp. XHP0104]MCV2882869.1 GyrI-like domain-containing protein [Actibacterium sp. XHP0104]